MKPIALTAALCLAAFPAVAEEDDDLGGTLNPEELTLNSAIAKAARGETSMMICAMGYPITKKGDHAEARVILEACANDGWTAAMTWMSQLENNGLGAEENPDAAAEWDRRAAEAGDPVGKFNYGLDLMRGRGVAQDEAEGRRWVDEAAADGLRIAKRLQAADYDLDEVTPDADNWKYAPTM